MIHHPAILIPKLVVLLALIALLILLHSVLTPTGFVVALISAGVFFVVFSVLLWFFVLRSLNNPDSSMSRATVLSHAASAERGFRATPEGNESLVGRRGVATSKLSPSGVATIDGKRLSVMTGGEFIEPRATVEVVEGRGSRIVVKKVADTGEPRAPADL
ncbi:MAG: NfeD family protein [Planctomycetota bacterium]